MSGPIVQIRIEQRIDREVVTFAPIWGDPLLFELPVGTLETARNNVPTMLREFKEAIGPALDPPQDKVDRAMRSLFERANMLGGTLTNEGSSGMRRLQALCVRALPDWATRVDVPLVQVEGPSYGFPFELLAVFDLSKPPSPISNLEVFSRRFLGFSAAVRRVPYLSGSGLGLPLDPVLKGGPLPLSLAWHTSLSGAKTEHDFFAGLAEHIELNGPWPAPELELQAVVEKLAQGLANPRQRYNASAGLGPDVQIHHFSCHCDTHFDDPADYELEIAGTDGQGHRITFVQLYNEFTYAQGASNPTRPLVFLNACGAAHQDPRRVYSLPKWFLENRHRAVIGPETLVPDEAAAQYACAFYRQLFAQRSAGEALVLARRYLLTKFRNPLGLLYVLYGDSSITVDQPIPQEVLDGGATQ